MAAKLGEFQAHADAILYWWIADMVRIDKKLLPLWNHLMKFYGTKGTAEEFQQALKSFYEAVDKTDSTMKLNMISYWVWSNSTNTPLKLHIAEQLRQAKHGITDWMLSEVNGHQ